MPMMRPSFGIARYSIALSGVSSSGGGRRGSTPSGCRRHLAVAHLDVGAVPANGHDRFALVAHAERDGDHAGVDVGETGRHLLLQARLATFTSPK